MDHPIQATNYKNMAETFDLNTLIQQQQQAIQSSQENKKTFKDMLTDRRANMGALSDEFAGRATGLIKGDIGKARVNPADVMNIYGNMKTAGRNYLQPFEQQYAEAGNQEQTGFENLMKLLGMQDTKKQQDFENQTKLMELGITEAKPVEIVAKEGDTSPNGEWEYQGGDWRPVGGSTLTDDQARQMMFSLPGGKDLWDKLGGSTPERASYVKGIIKEYGSLENYLQSGATLTDLLSDEEEKARGVANELRQTAERIIGGVTDENGNVINATGVGILGGRLPGWVKPKGASLRSDVTLFTADKMKQLSGATVSDKEVARLINALPKTGDTEELINNKAKQIRDVITAGMQLQELAKRNMMTLDQAYEKFGADVYTKMGLSIPSWMSKSSSSSSGPQPTTANYIIEEVK